MNAHASMLDSKAAAKVADKKTVVDPALFRRILLATGETTPCKQAAAFAKEIARRYGSEIV
jgi:hypothetical protein